MDLADVLRLIGGNPWRWRIEDFEGSALPDSELNILEVEESVRRGEFLHFDWQSLVSFAGQLNQMVRGRLVAQRDDEVEPVLVLVCIDSSLWDLAARDDDPEAIAALGRAIRWWPSLT